MSDRGTYRAIKIVLLDGPDFQGLPERSRHLFQTLKLTFGPTGIEVRYPGALEAELSAKTGIPVEAVSGPLDTLEEREWINREGNIVWIVGQLKHDPHMSWDDDKHRKSVWRHLQGLPRLAIVGEFVRCYRRWFEAGESVTVRNDPKPLAPAPHDLLCWLDDTPSKAHQRPIEGPSKAHGRPFGGPGPSSDPDSNLLSVDNRSSRLSDAIPSDPTRPIEGPSEALARPIEAPSTEYRVLNTEEGEPSRAQAREVFHTGGGVPSGSDPPGSDGGLDPPHSGRRMSGAEVLVAWENAQPVAVSAAERRKQKPFARRIADGHTREQVMAAFVGIGQLFPHCAPKNQPWDLSDLDRKFSKAVAAARDHPELKSRRFDEEFTAMTER